MGPKPRATISVVGTENLGVYHVKIFAKGGFSNQPPPEGNEKYDFVFNYNIEGYKESFIFYNQQGDFKYNSHYYAHDYYQIVIFSENGDTIIRSPMFKREFFEGFYTYNLGGNTFQELAEKTNQETTTYGSVKAEYKWEYIVVSTLARMLITMAVECLIGLVVFRNKHALKIIGITNLISNYALNQTLSIIDFVEGFQLVNYFIFYWAFEVVVILVESIVYCKTMPKERKLKIVLYTLLSNIATFALGTFVGVRIYDKIFYQL